MAICELFNVGLSSLIVPDEAEFLTAVVTSGGDCEPTASGALILVDNTEYAGD